MWDVRTINNMFIFTDKTNNIYKIYSKNHEKRIKKSSSKTYKKVLTKLENLINLEARNITKNISLADGIEHLSRTESFIKLIKTTLLTTQHATYSILQKTNLEN